MTQQYFSNQFPHKRVPTGHNAKNPTSKWKLTYRVGKMASQEICIGNYPLCVAERDKRKNDVNWKLGKFFIDRC